MPTKRPRSERIRNLGSRILFRDYLLRGRTKIQARLIGLAPSNLAASSNCSRKTRPMPRVMAPAVNAETASPTIALPGTAKASVEAVAVPTPVGTAPPTSPMMVERVRSRSNGPP